MNTIIGTSGPTLLNAGQDLWTGLAAIMVVWDRGEDCHVGHLPAVGGNQARSSACGFRGPC